MTNMFRIVLQLQKVSSKGKWWDYTQKMGEAQSNSPSLSKWRKAAERKGRRIHRNETKQKKNQKKTQRGGLIAGNLSRAPQKGEKKTEEEQTRGLPLKAKKGRHIR